MRKPTKITIRPSVEAFAMAMELELRKHDRKRGNQNDKIGCKDTDCLKLILHAEEETSKMRNTYCSGQPYKMIAKEAIFIAVLAMDICDKALKLCDKAIKLDKPKIPPKRKKNND